MGSKYGVSQDMTYILMAQWKARESLGRPRPTHSNNEEFSSSQLGYL